MAGKECDYGVTNFCTDAMGRGLHGVGDPEGADAEAELGRKRLKDLGINYM